MSYELDIDRAHETVVVTVACALDQTLRKEILVDVSKALEDNDYVRAIIDVTRATFNPDEPMAGAMELTRFMGIIGIKPHMKLAFIYADAETHRKFFETIAQLDGYELKYFRDVDEAKAWLA